MVFLNFILLLSEGAVLGALAVRRLDPHRACSRGERIALGAAVGAVLEGFFILFLALATGNLLLSVYLVIGAALAVGFARRKAIIPARGAFSFSIPPLDWRTLALAAMFLVYLGVIFQVLLWDADGFPRAVLVGWGDTAYHLDIIGRLADVQPFRLAQPIAAGEPLTYPPLVDSLSAVLKKIGMPDSVSWYFPMVLFGSATFLLLYFLGVRLLGARGLALILVGIVLFGGGLGFFQFFEDLRAGYGARGIEGIAQTIVDPPHEYTHLDTRTGGKPSSADAPLNIVWMVPAVSFFAHQRSFAAGAAIALAALLGLLAFRQEEKGKERVPQGRWLVLLGFLPFIHPHSFFAMAIASSVLFLVLVAEKGPRREIREWLWGGVAAIAISLPQVLYLMQIGSGEGSLGGGFFRPWFGWMACSHQQSWFFCDPGVAGTDANVLWFWTKNFGIVFWGWVLAVIFFATRRSRGALARRVVLASAALFLLPNLVLLQPWEFDNNKALFYWWASAVFLILLALREARPRLPRYAFALLLVVFVAVGGLAGSVDVFARIRRAFFARAGEHAGTHFGFYGSEEVEAAKWIRSHAGANDAFLTADGANNFIPMLAGRPIFLGFPGWLWTQGRNATIAGRQAAIQRFFQSQDPAELCAEGARWMVWEPALFASYPAARGLDITRVGEVRFSQDVPAGQRHIIRLQCGPR